MTRSVLIEEIPGSTTSAQVIKTLEERGWVDVDVGHRDFPASPPCWRPLRNSSTTSVYAASPNCLRLT